MDGQDLGAGGLVAKVGGPRNAALIGAGATVVVVGWMSYRKKQASGAAAAAAAAGGAAAGPQIVNPSTADTSIYDLGNQWQQQYEQLQGQLNSLQNNVFSKPPAPVPVQTPPPQPTAPNTVAVGHNEPVGEVVAWADSHGYPNYSWSDFWALNPNISGLQQVNGTWELTGWGTPVNLSKPGFTSAGSGSISDDWNGTRGWTTPAPAPAPASTTPTS